MFGSRNKKLGEHLARWCTGDYRDVAPDGALDVVVTEPAAGHDLISRAAAVGLHIGRDTTVFWPEGSKPPQDVVASGAGIASFEGSVLADGELLVNGAISMATLAYAMAPFTPVTGPTVLRMTERTDVEDFLADADQAQQEGVFADHLVHHLVQLADICAVTHWPCGGRARQRAAAFADELRPSPYGVPLSGPPADTDACTCNGTIAGSPELTAALAARPWLTRFMDAVRIVAALRAQGTSEVAVSGFGGRLTHSAPAAPVEVPGAPVLVTRDGEHVLCDPSSLRVLRLAPDAARVAELILVSGPVSLAELADRVSSELTVTTPAASEAAATVRARLAEMRFAVPELVSA